MYVGLPPLPHNSLGSRVQVPTIQEGMAEPEMDRLLQGAAVERVGEAVGKRVREAVGKRVGEVVGKRVGEAVRKRVGASDGETETDGEQERIARLSIAMSPA